MADDLDTIGDSYSRVARAYADRFGDELIHKPLDRALLEVVVAERPAGSVVADVGCGPGHVTAHIHDLGVSAVGVDPSPGMIELARERHPGIDFQAGSLLDLGVPDGAWGAIVALYSIIHLPGGALGRAMAECARALRAGGVLLLSFHVGEGVVHRDEFLGEAVTLDFHMLTVTEVAAACEEAALEVTARLERQPYAAVEGPTVRGYLLARKPS